MNRSTRDASVEVRRGQHTLHTLEGTIKELKEVVRDAAIKPKTVNQTVRFS